MSDFPVRVRVRVRGLGLGSGVGLGLGLGFRVKAGDKSLPPNYDRLGLGFRVKAGDKSLTSSLLRQGDLCRQVGDVLVPRPDARRGRGLLLLEGVGVPGGQLVGRIGRGRHAGGCLICTLIISTLNNF